MAKLECSDEVTIKHVSEAKRLLSKSIVTVEQPDIDLEKVEDDGMDVDMNDAPPIMEALNALDHDMEAETPTRKLYHLYTLKCLCKCLCVVVSLIHPSFFLYIIFIEHKKKLTMSFEEYKNLSNMLVLYMRNEETRAESETVATGISRLKLLFI